MKKIIYRDTIASCVLVFLMTAFVGLCTTAHYMSKCSALEYENTLMKSYVVAGDSLLDELSRDIESFDDTYGERDIVNNMINISNSIYAIRGGELGE